MANQPKKYKKFVATAATATLVASAIVPVASAKSFSDVAENNEFQPFIDALSETGVINGYPDGTFKPGNKLTRGQVVKMLGRWVESTGKEIPSDWNSVQRFNDVPTNSADEELVKYAALVKDEGVFTGSNGNLMANNNITRQQMAKVLNGAYEAVNGTSLVELAEDIDDEFIQDLATSQQEFEGYIQALVDLEISTVSVFRPTENVTRAQFAKFLYNTINLEKISAYTVKVVNNTTVEVTFPKEIKGISNIDFAIEGLEVKNAVVKQSDKNTAVLTTTSQEAGKEYTVTVNGEEVGTFIGATAVIPTKVDIVEKSLQAAVGTQVTLKAQVTVAEGQSKEGIPVTFNIVNTANINTATLNQPIVAEATTNADGVATYTYTRYAETSLQIASHDEVQAYATGNPTARSFSKVYWANIQPLDLTEVTQGNDIQNGGKKVYKVTAALNHTETVTAAEYAANTAYYNAKGIYGAGQYVNIGFEENTNVTPDKAIKTIDVIDASGRNLGYPGQYLTSTTGGNNLNNWVKEVKIKLDNAGQAIFTLSGLDNAVTPYVFVDQKVNPANDNGTSGRFEATELFDKAPKVTFKKLHTLNIGLQAIGEQYAAAFYNSRVQNKTLVHDGDYVANTLEGYLNRILTTAELAAATVDAGGRDYKITIKDEKGQVAPINTKVGIKIDIGSSQRTLGGAVYLVDNNTKKITKLTGDAANNGKGVEFVDFNLLTTDAKGEVSFTLIGYKDAYAKPTVVIDSGNDQGKVDNNDQKFEGEVVYFSDARVAKATLTASKTTATSTETVEYVYQTVDQNGKVYRPSLNSLDYNNPSVNNVPVTFQVSTTFNTVDVTAGKGIVGSNGYKFVNLNTNGPVTVGQDSMGNFGGIYETFTVIADEFGKASINVTGKGLGTTVNVTASTSLASLNQLLTASTVFGSSQVVSGYTGYVTESKETYIQFEGEKSPLFYDTTTAKYQLIGGATLTKAEFDAIVNKKDVKAYVQYKVENGVTTFTILTVNGVAPGSLVFTSTTQNVANDVNTLGLVGTTATSSNAAVATAAVTANGVEVKSVAPGTAVITVTDADPATTDATINVTVSATGAITYTINKAGAVQVGNQTVGQYVTTALNVNAFNDYAVAIAQSSLTGDLQGATAVKLTVKGTEYTGTLTSGYFVFAVPTSAATEAEVKAGILTKIN